MSQTHRFFVPQALVPKQKVTLDADTSHYLTKVLRLRPGNAIVLFNGDNHIYPAVIDSMNKKAVTVMINDQTFASVESSLSLHLGQVISRGEKMDWILQKATELGVNEITLLNSELSNVKYDAERLAKKYSHWQKVITSACEQCGRNLIPTLKPLMPLNDWLTQIKADSKFFLHPYHSVKLRAEEFSPQTVALAIGPEGGFSEKEQGLATSHGWQSIRLGPRVLRMETAALAAISLVGGYFGDLG